MLPSLCHKIIVILLPEAKSQSMVLFLKLGRSVELDLEILSQCTNSTAAISLTAVRTWPFASSLTSFFYLFDGGLHFLYCFRITCVLPRQSLLQPHFQFRFFPGSSDRQNLSSSGKDEIDDVSDESLEGSQVDRIPVPSEETPEERIQKQLSMIRLCEERFGPEDVSTLEAVRGLGLLYSRQQQFQKADELCMRALTGMEKVLGQDHQATVNLMADLGEINAGLQNGEKAIDFYHRAASGHQKIHGPDNEYTLGVLGAASALYHNELNNYIEAESQFKIAFDGSERLLGLEHPQILEVLVNLGLAYTALSKRSEAEECLKRARQGYDTIHGPDSQEGLQALWHFYRSENRLAEAEAVVRKQLKLCEDTYGLQDIRSVEALCNVAAVERRQGRRPEAEESYKRVLEASANKLDSYQDEAVCACVDLAKIYQSQGKEKEELAMLEQAFTPLEKLTVLFKRNIWCKWVVEGSFDIYIRRRELDEAEKLKQRAFSSFGYLVEGSQS